MTLRPATLFKSGGPVSLRESTTMTNGTIFEDDPADREPRAITLSDLIALVVGVAVVLRIPWVFWPDPRDRIGSSASWIPYVWLAGQVLELSCLALLPVIILRRARFGGLIRPAEFLTVCCGFPALTWGAEILLISTFVRYNNGVNLRGPGLIGIPRRAYWQWQNGYHWTWEYGLVIAAFSASAALLIGRRRLPGSLRSALLMMVWLGIYETAPWLLRQSALYVVTRFFTNGILSGVNGLIIASLTRNLPRFVLFSIPFLVTVDALQIHKRSRNWVESIGLIFAVLIFLGAEAMFLIRNSSDYSPLSMWLRETILIHLLAMLASISIGLLIARRIGPAWVDATRPIDIGS